MSTSDRWWVIGAFAVTLAGASAFTWQNGAPHLEASTAHATSRRSAPGRRPCAAEAPLLSDDASSGASPDETPPALLAPVARGSPARPSPPSAAPSASVSIDVPDLPEPPAHAPLLWDELFPQPPRAHARSGEATSRPCFDQLQGIRGLSPCSAVSTSAMGP